MALGEDEGMQLEEGEDVEEGGEEDGEMMGRVQKDEVKRYEEEVVVAEHEQSEV